MVRRGAWSACVTPGGGLGAANGQSPDEENPPLEILLLHGSLGISLEPESAWIYVQQREASAWGFLGSTWETPTLNGSPMPREAAWDRSCPAERLVQRAGPGPSPPTAAGQQAEQACGRLRSLRPGCFEAWGFIPRQSARASNAALSLHHFTASAPRRASVPHSPAGTNSLAPTPEKGSAVAPR